MRAIFQGDWETLVEEIDGGTFKDVRDTVQHLDRLFFVCVSKGKIDQSRSPADLLALAAMPKGVWYAVIADAPLHAWAHVRDHEPNPASGGNVCPECFVEIKARREPGARMLELAMDSQHQT
jgi:hypothetical protein